MKVIEERLALVLALRRVSPTAYFFVRGRLAIHPSTGARLSRVVGKYKHPRELHRAIRAAVARWRMNTAAPEP